MSRTNTLCAILLSALVSFSGCTEGLSYLDGALDGDGQGDGDALDMECSIDCAGDDCWGSQGWWEADLYALPVEKLPELDENAEGCWFELGLDLERCAEDMGCPDWRAVGHSSMTTGVLEDTCAGVGPWSAGGTITGQEGCYAVLTSVVALTR